LTTRSAENYIDEVFAQPEGIPHQRIFLPQNLDSPGEMKKKKNKTKPRDKPRVALFEGKNAGRFIDEPETH